MPSKEFIKKTTKNILNGTLNATSYLVIACVELGEITLESFFNSKYSYTKPTRMLLGMDSKTVDNYRKKVKINTLRQNIRRLVKQGILENNTGKIKLSRKGREMMQYILNRKKILNKKWDKKYRVVIFDIPEKKKHLRNWLRKELYLLNYIQLQKSVFVSKYPLTKDIVKDVRKLGIGENVNYMLVEKIFNEDKLFGG